MSRSDQDRAGGHRESYWSKRRSGSRQFLQKRFNRKLRRTAKRDIEADGRTRHRALWEEH